MQYRTQEWDEDRARPPRALLHRLTAVISAVMSAVGFRRPHEAARLYLGAWSRTMPFNDFLQRFQDLLREEGLTEDVEQAPLLFEHDLDALSGELRRRGGRWPGRGDAVHEQTVAPERAFLQTEAARRFFHAIRAALVDDPACPTRSQNSEVMFPSPLMHVGRREAALLATGALPVLFNAPGKALALSDERVHLYLDVSGSMDDTLAFVTGLTLSVGSLVGPTLHQFSNRVVSITWQQLAQGHVATTGGTDLDCVARHANEHGYRRILIVTDGHVQLAESSRRLLRRQLETFVVIVGWPSQPPPRVTRQLEDFARRCWVLPPL